MRRDLVGSILVSIQSKNSGKTQNKVGTVGTLEQGGPDGAVPTKLFQPVPTFVPTSDLRRSLNNNSVPTVPTVPTTKTNSSAPDAKTVPEASPSTSEHGWNAVGTEIDAEPDFTIYLDDPAFAQQVADERNAASVAAGRTDRYCACQKMATVTVGKRRVSPTNPAGVDRWLCSECFEAGGPFPVPSPRKSSPGVADAPPIELNSVPRPDEPARDDWWGQPAQGWREGKLTISPTIGDETFEIHLKEGQNNDD